MPSLPNPTLRLGRRSAADVVGLDIQPGHIAAVQARVNGSVVAERAATLPLPADTVREGEVLDESVLGDTLRELFRDSRLSKRVRVGVANQRTVLRTLELPPITDRKELDAAVRFQAQEQVPMPLANAVLDFHPLGVHDTPTGPRQQVVLVAAQRDMVARLLAAVRGAGLRPEGVDLSAFALIRSLYRSDAEHDGRVLYLNVDGLTNMAIAEGAICRFTRVVGGGLEAMASELAERRGVAVADARALISSADLLVSAPGSAEPALPEPGALEALLTESTSLESQTPAAPADPESSTEPYAESLEDALNASESFAALAEQTPQAPDAEVRAVLENGIREIAGEVRNSLEFHRSQEGGGEVALVVLSGAALDVPGFADILEAELGVAVTRETVGMADGALDGAGDVSPQRLAVAAGLAIEEAHTR
ncbi:MAG TPA: type IV pilus assembly protein PilM [Solirubrobacteraceae bacterium]|jgi:type IV pilus assembly protein PilM|nr:type IV pilus assembly protein PilM [Solirubrobacteraceae bacterium]